ncbi:hypothetical protein RF55_4143 [Lasius niger]|uniref:Uncharacterized protein n=1 Tax=Lasius niger TaxID=67767 RepID=A0A0J7KYP2_LASNI|nr:hypothetical protein RF55_4143 [Lasius niger]
MEVNNVEEEDENVVIQGSALHEHLSKLGYTDFESVSMPKTTRLEEKQYLNINIRSTIEKIYAQLFSFYSWITQERSISEKQLSTILNAEALLNDHFFAISSFASKRNDNSKNHFMGKKLQYLQPLIEILVSFMGNISRVYYQCSLSIVKLLPPNVLNEELFTKFECNSFEISGEIDYQALKKLYHTYLLVQSEMLYLLAIAYDNNTWILARQVIPETKLAHIIHTLIKELTVHKVKLSEVISAYHSCKVEPVRHKVQRAKWQDPTVQLDLASYKLQSAYNQVFSIFKDIDDCISQEIGIGNETTEILMQKLDRAFKEIDIAKSLMEFVVLLMSKSGFDKPNDDQSVTNDTTIDQNPNLPVIIDSDPEILDEVFEEYIKDDYLEPLHADTDEYSLEQQKLDKLLVKNFMSELKEALVEKHKSVSERESKALQRIYKNISKDSVSNTENNKDCQFIPVPPPMPPYTWSSSSSDINSRYKRIIPPTCTIKSDDSSIQEKIDDSDSIRVLKNKNTFNTPSIEACETKDEECLTFLPQILLGTQATQFVTKLPSAFLQEETFVGSGENSEDEEIIDNSSDNANNKENENS